MATIKVGIIDDGYPVLDEKFLTTERIEELTTSAEDWGQEESLRELSIKLTGKSRIWKKRIQFSGFNHPQTFKENNDFSSDFLIYDWEYKPVSASTEDFFDILNETSSKIFIYSAYDKIDRIPELLVDDKFAKFRAENRYEIKSKGNDDDTDAIIGAIMKKFEDGEDVIWEGLPIRIIPSRHLIDQEDFWKIKSVVGTETLLGFAQEVKLFNEQSIEELFSKLPDTYFIDTKKNILSSAETELLSMGFGKLQKITALEALKAFTMDKLEEAKEKGYAEIK
jgi:hypothetical protein